jgi:hypothetical protein
MQRIQRANWQETSIESDDYRLELHEVHGLTEVGFVLWRKRDDEHLDLITSGHTFQGKLVGSELEPLGLTDATENTIMELLAR